jgi:hypothetical protein
MYKRERGFERIVIDGVEHDSGLVVLHRLDLKLDPVELCMIPVPD